MQDWWKKATVYQIYPRSFNDSNGDGVGDLQGMIEKLDYLKELGIDLIWLSPVYDSPNDDNGYDIRDYYSINPEFGTMEDFDQLLDEVHKRDMKLMMDLVVNHTSDEHQWFKEHEDYYIWREKPNNWQSIFGGSAWEYDEEKGKYYLHLFSKKQPDLNWENPELRKRIYEMMHWWLQKGVDGFRMDVINFISKHPDLPDGPNGDGSDYFMNGPRIHEFLQEMNDEVLSHYNCVTVGEMPGTTPEDAQVYTDPNNREVNMIFTFEHMDLDHGPDEKWDYKPLNLIDLKENLEKWQNALYDKGWNSLYWNNHDQPRIVSRFGDDTNYRYESATMLATCLHFLQGTPYIYQGEEIGMTNVAFSSIADYKDIETLNMYNDKKNNGIRERKILDQIHHVSRDNARTPMQWTANEQASFTTGTPWIQVNPNFSEINVESDLKQSKSIYNYYKALIKLRKEVSLITTGKFKLIYREHPNLFAYKREGKGETITVYCNFSDQTIEVDEQPKGETLIHNYDVQANSHQITLRPYETIVYKGQ
ncbi:glycoside hydrolase family 13 protein [Alkalibacillus haloalkaliphilus]|uniref:oligo-1,6-glucosidase n=1 Tax=Alkalibacillus haloalkaliphilus TaxID=94136 RepID=A0A511W0H6_9BACI|nr:alpha-glucosidase [Alkalibacillus haloalkaliphilus]GEN44589.1 glucohydrolase [Alkalibacillus haloalkaliphilus]